MLYKSNLTQAKPIRRFRANNQITSSKLRVLDENGEQLGIFSLADALKAAAERGLDLIEVVPQAQPPIAKIIEYGKFLYQESKKERSSRTGQKNTETKGVRIGVKTSPHDLELKANQAQKFISEGHRVRLEMILRGREKAHRDFAKERFQAFVNTIVEKGFKLDQEIKSQPFGFTAIIGK